MKADLIIYNARQLVTCASNGKAKKGSQMQELGIFENGAVAIENGLIKAVGTSEEILKHYQFENTIDANQKVVMPAFVDPHTHIIYAGNRLNEFELKIKGADYLEILANGNQPTIFGDGGQICKLRRIILKLRTKIRLLLFSFSFSVFLPCKVLQIGYNQSTFHKNFPADDLLFIVFSFIED